MSQEICVIQNKNGDKAVALLKRNLDNKEVRRTASVSEFIDLSKGTRFFPERILISTSTVQGNDLEDLFYYLQDNSQDTEVVLIAQGTKDIQIRDDFNRLFDDDRYTSATQEKISTSFLTKLASQPLLNLKSAEELLIGEDPEDDDLEVPAEEVDPEEENIFVSPNASPPASSMGFSSFNWGSENAFSSQEEEDSQPGEEPSFSDGGGFADFVSPENGEASSGELSSSSESKEDSLDFLNMGDFGGSHIETGFLNEEEVSIDPLGPTSGSLDEVVEEINEEINETVFSGDLRNRPEESFGSPFSRELPQARDLSDTIEEVIPVMGTAPVAPVESVVPSAPVHQSAPYAQGTGEIPSDGRVQVITGTREADTANFSIVKGLALAGEGKRVLLVDLDLKSHNILSNIDLTAFLKVSRGLRREFIYEEDGLFFASPGYSNNVNAVVLKEFLSSVANMFDFILIDSPFDVLSDLPIELTDAASLNLVVDGNYQGFIRAFLTMDEVPNSWALNFIHRGKLYVQNVGDTTAADLDEVLKLIVPRKVNWLEDAYESIG